jgi:hypothetical protein
MVVDKSWHSIEEYQSGVWVLTMQTREVSERPYGMGTTLAVFPSKRGLSLSVHNFHF